MSESIVQMRLIRSDRWQQVAEWDQLADTRDGEQMRDALIDAVKGQVGADGDWKKALPFYVMQWRWGSSCGWRTWRAAK